MTIPYSRPPAVTMPKATAPKAPKAPAQMSWGRSLFGQQPKPPAPTHSVNDQFMLGDPYDPTKLSSLATQGYNADVENAKKVAAIGSTPGAQITADFAQRGQAGNAVYQALQQQLAGIQTANVAQGNAGAAALGAQTAGLGAPAGVQAVLGANTAATGNYGGSLQAAALSAGAQANQRALDAGVVARQQNDQSVAKTLQSLLSGVDPVSKRVDTMRSANQGVDATNKQVLLSLYQGDKQAESTAAALGDKKAEALAQRQEQTDLAKITQGGANYRANLSAKTSAGNAALSATTSAGNTAANIAARKAAAAQDRAFKAAQSKLARGVQLSIADKRAVAAQTKAKGGVKNYYVSVVYPKKPLQAAIPGVAPGRAAVAAKPAVLHISAKVWDAFNRSGPMGRRKLAILGVPEGTVIRKATGY